MSSILGADGNPAQRKFIHGADQSRRRGAQFGVQNASLDDLITDRDRDAIVSDSKRLAANLGPVKCVVDQKSTYSVGQAWLVSYTGKEDREQAKQVVDWFHTNFFHTLDVRGGQWDWHENLEQLSAEIDISGDHFTLLTASEEGTQPRIQNIPAYSVKTKGSDLERSGRGYKIKGGLYNNHRIITGIIYDSVDKAVAYRVSNGHGPDDFEDIPATHIHHSFDPSQSDGRRGLPAATSALNELKHVMQSTESESRRQLILASIGLLVENEDGGMDADDPANAIMGNYTDDGAEVTAQKIDSSIWYAQAGSGYKLSQMKHESGGDSFESFQDRMIRSFVAGAKWSYSLVWKASGQGTAERGEILQARQAVIERQKRLDKWAKRVTSYAYAFMAQRGELPTLKSPFGWTFSRPPRITVDDGREEKMLNEGLKLGTRNLDELLAYKGQTRTEFLTQRAEWLVEEAQILEAHSKSSGYDLEQRRMFMPTPNEVKPITEDESNSN